MKENTNKLDIPINKGNTTKQKKMGKGFQQVLHEKRHANGNKHRKTCSIPPNVSNQINAIKWVELQIKVEILL